MVRGHLGMKAVPRQPPRHGAPSFASVHQTVCAMRGRSPPVHTRVAAIEVAIIGVVIVQIIPARAIFVGGRWRGAPILKFDNADAHKVMKPGQLVVHDLAGLEVKRIVGDGHVRLRDENDLLIVNEAWMSTPSRYEELGVIILRAYFRRRELDVGARPAEDGLGHSLRARVQRDTPHPDQYPIVEGACSCRRRSPPRMPN